MTKQGMIQTTTSALRLRKLLIVINKIKNNTITSTQIISDYVIFVGSNTTFTKL